MIGSIIWRAGVIAVASLGVFGFVAPSQAVQLWGIRPATNEIVRVDPATGAVLGGFTPPGGALLPTQLFGGLTIAEHGAVLLYQNPVANPTSLFRLDPDTGALLSTESMPAAGNPEFRAGLSFESGAGAGGADAIFAVNNGAPVQRQDGYGDASLSNHTPSGAAFAGALGGDDNGRHFLATEGSILEFDPSNSNAPINTIPGPPVQLPVTGLAYDGQRIYLSEQGGRLFTIDPSSGAVLDSVLVPQGGLIGLAARGVPEPGTIALAIVAGAGWFGRFRQVRRQRR